MVMMMMMMEEGKNNNKGHEIMEGRKSNNNTAPFLLKTYMMVEDPSTDHVISWNADGTAFVVWQPPEFARDLLPTLFKHSNFSSFVRQLNTYGFRKAATNRWEFCNSKFRKGEKEKLSEIRRRKAWSNRKNRQQQEQTSNNNIKECSEEEQRSSSTSSSCGYLNLMDENKRLKRENGALNSELVAVKRKCKHLLELVSKHSKKNDEQDERPPMLFGVRLDVNTNTTDSTIFLPQSNKFMSLRSN